MFVSRVRAEGSGDRSPWGDFWFTPVGGARTAAGARVSADTALQLSTVYACTRVLTESFAVLPFKLYRPRANGAGRDLVTQHWSYNLFRRRPNRFHNPFIWRELLQGHLVLRGNAFNEIIDDSSGGVAELLPRHPDRIKIELLPNESWRYIYTQPDGSLRYIRRDKMWHIRGLSSDGIVGMGPIELQRESIGAGLAAKDYANRFFANDAKPTGGWIEFPGTIADKSARENLTESIKNAISGQNRHRILTLDRGMKYHEVGMTNKDSQFLEVQQATRSEIAGWMRVPPHMIGDLSRATFSNIEQQSIDFWQNAMLPWCERWEAAVEELIGDDTLEVEFDFKNLMRGDSESRAKRIHMLVLDGVMTRNEARQEEGLNPIGGLDEPLVPVNEMTLEESQEPDEPVQPPGVGEPAKEQPGSADARMVALLRGNATRMARRFKGGFSFADAPVIAEALAIPQSVVSMWIDRTVGAPRMTEDELTEALYALGAAPL